MSEFLAGFLEGAKETPRAYFAPLIAIWRLLYTETSSLLTTKRRKI
ncbi:MAG TPA: hypothetical protein VF428_00125 [Casimicrobiaceae bacterium]